MNNEYDNEVVQLIRNNDLKRLKRVCMTKGFCDHILLPFQQTLVINNEEKFYIKGPTPIIYSILCNRYELLEYLVSHTKANLILKVHGKSAIHYAAMQKNTKCLSILLEQQQIKDYIDQLTDDGVNALHIAVNFKNYDAVDILLNIQGDEESFECARFDVDSQTSTGNTPLHLAVYQRDCKMLLKLINHGASHAISNNKGITPQQFAENLHFNTGVQILSGEVTEYEEKKAMSQIKPEIKFDIAVNDQTAIIVDSSDSDQDSDSDDESIESATIVGLKSTISALTRKVDQLTAVIQGTPVPKLDLKSIEQQNIFPPINSSKSVHFAKAPISKELGPPINSASVKTCISCGQIGTIMHPLTGKCYCNVCYSKEVHSKSNM